MSSLGNRLFAELRGDRVIWVIMLVLGVASVLAIYSSTGTIAYRNQGGNTEFYVAKHAAILGFGFILAYLCYSLHHRTFSKLAPFLILICIPLLMYTIFFGAEINEARRWITIPFIGLSFQTSDFAKIALIIYVARAISGKQDIIKDFDSAFLPIIIPILIVCSLIAPADLSSALVLFMTCLLMMFIGRVHWKFLMLLLFLGVVAFAFLIVLGEFAEEFVRVDTWVERMRQFMSGDESVLQVTQSKIAIANGEVFGLGAGNSIQRNFLPSPYADFIYSIIWEEYGMTGGFIILSLYVLLFFRTVSIVTKSPKAFGAILAVGLSLMIVIQALANIAVSVNFVPVTGLPLPMVSMGGTSLLFTCIAFGMILSVSKNIEKAT